jgi:hypothetical protein
MRQLKCYSVLLLFLALTACDQSDIVTDPKYPERISPLAENQLDAILNELGQTSFAMCVAIDTFGYPIIDSELDFCLMNDSVAYTDDLIQIKEAASAAFNEYAFFLNSNNIEVDEIELLSTIDGTSYNDFMELYPDSVPAIWVAKTGLQYHEGLPVRGTSLTVWLSSSGVEGLSGQRYSRFFVPANDNFDEAAAKEMLLNKSFSHGKADIVINTQTLWHDSKKLIVPIRKSEYIELRVCLALYPKGWEILVDCHTGEIISSISI